MAVLNSLEAETKGRRNTLSQNPVTQQAFQACWVSLLKVKSING